MAQFYFGRKTQNITVKVTESQKDTITEAAKKEGLSVSEFLMLALEFYFDKHGVESTHSPSEIALEQQIEEEVADSEGEEEKVDLVYMNGDKSFYQKMVDDGDSSNLYRAIKSCCTEIYLDKGFKGDTQDVQDERDFLLEYWDIEKD